MDTGRTAMSEVVDRNRKTECLTLTLDFMIDVQWTLLDINFRPPNFCLHPNGGHAVNFNCTATSLGLFESLFSQLLNALSFESEAAHLRSRIHGREKVHVF